MPKVTFQNELITVEVAPGRNLLEIAEDSGIEVFRGIWPGLHCDRMKGWCNRCKLWATPLAPGALNERTSKEKARFRLNGRLPSGGNMRLACQVIVSGDCEVRTRAGAPPRTLNAEWAPDPRPSKWRDRWEHRNDEPDEEEAPAKAAKAATAKAAAKPAAVAAAATATAPAASAATGSGESEGA